MGKLHFYTMFIGVNVTFFPMHFLGLNGMARRIPEYADGYVGYNKVATWGSTITILSAIIFIKIIRDSIISEWGVREEGESRERINKEYYSKEEGEGETRSNMTLEWSVGNLPSHHTFNEMVRN